jgi:hypothetical protein
MNISVRRASVMLHRYLAWPATPSDIQSHGAAEDRSQKVAGRLVFFGQSR